MIGRFKTARAAIDTEHLLQRFVDLATREAQSTQTDSVSRPPRFSDAMIKLMRSNHVNDLTALEQEQFTYDFSLRRQGSQLVVHTDEIDTMALLKVLIDREAKVEVYSAHFHKDDDAPDSDD